MFYSSIPSILIMRVVKMSLYNTEIKKLPESFQNLKVLKFLYISESLYKKILEEMRENLEIKTFKT